MFTENDNFEPKAIPSSATVPVHKWEGEDEDDEVKDNWEDEEEEEEKKDIEKQEPLKPVVKKGKKALLEKIEEKEVSHFCNKPMVTTCHPSLRLKGDPTRSPNPGTLGSNGSPQIQVLMCRHPDPRSPLNGQSDPLDSMVNSQPQYLDTPLSILPPGLQRKREKVEKQPKREELTSEEIQAEKLRQQKLQEESDLLVAMETFGVAQTSTGTGIDAMNPSSIEEFNELQEALSKKVQQYTKSEHFPEFAENLIRNICVNLSSYDLKKLKTTIENMFLEKSKVEKGDKAKKNKGKAKAKLRVEGENSLVNEYSAYADYDDFDDFM
ncbi:unnamed protein product [Timema podura]|uniref:Eukaryotic translation initiation factor 3 subunit J n=3 Tax=Timema TaxID=61471 RepID=A0ABN7P2I9_TIMPD|nr:unnamed protein product [Timema podura]